jgi:molybdopterin converting factor small subunit
VKISVKSIFEPNERVLEKQSATLGALLDDLTNKYRAEGTLFIDVIEVGKVAPCYAVFLNGKTHRGLDEGLDTKLQDGDKVEIKLLVLAGG